jgi:hypothetical protein
MFGSSQRPPAQQKFTHLMVYDFEATCNKERYVHNVPQRLHTACAC